MDRLAGKGKKKKKKKKKENQLWSNYKTLLTIILGAALKRSR